MTALAAPDRTSRIESVGLAMACAGFAAVGPLVVIAPKGLWLAGLIIAFAHGLRSAGGGLRHLGRTLSADLARLRVLWMLAALGLASATWAVVPEHSLIRGLRLFLEFGVGALIIGLAAITNAAHARLFLRAMAAGLAAAALLAIADMQLDGWLLFWAHNQPTVFNAYGRGASFASIAIVPMSILLWQQGSRIWMLGLFVAIGAFVLVAPNETAKYVFVAAILGAIAAFWRWSRPLPVLGFAVALVAIPLVLPQPLNGPIGCAFGEEKFSLLHRLGIWNFVDSAIGERPLLGWGLEASRKIPGGTTMLATPDCGAASIIDAERHYVHERLPLHPHDFALNLWLELGAVGAFLLLCALLNWAYRLYRLPRQRAMALCALAAGALLPATMSFGMWQGWWLTSLFVLVTLCLLAPRLAETPAGARAPATSQQASRETLIRAGRTTNLAL